MEVVRKILNNNREVKKHNAVIPQLALIIQKTLDELILVSEKLIPFDRIFDEDELIATYEQYEILNMEIRGLSAMMSCDANATADIKEKLMAFTDILKSTESKLDTMHEERFVEYSKWKLNYLKTAEKIQTIKTKLERLREVEETLTYYITRRQKIDIFDKIILHSAINTLLKCLNYDKQSTPYTAFKSAYEKRLIDDKTFIYLTK